MRTFPPLMPPLTREELFDAQVVWHDLLGARGVQRVGRVQDDEDAAPLLARQRAAVPPHEAQVEAAVHGHVPHGRARAEAARQGGPACHLCAAGG